MKVKNVWIFKCEFCDKELHLSDGWSNEAKTSSLAKYRNEYNGWSLRWKFGVNGSVFLCEEHGEPYMRFKKDLEKWEEQERRNKKKSYFDFLKMFEKMYKPEVEKPKIDDYIKKD